MAFVDAPFERVEPGVHLLELAVDGFEPAVDVAELFLDMVELRVHFGLELAHLHDDDDSIVERERTGGLHRI